LPRGWRPWLGRLLSGYLDGLGHGDRSVILLVADDAELRRLNARHRGLRRPTDILSFGYPAPEGGAGGRAHGSAPALLGELAVSWDRVRIQAKANGWPPRTELARLLAHGCAHLAGFDHATPAQERRMLPVEERLLAAAGFPGLYPGKPRRRRKPTG
jgi:probable rRNA maturation factor